MDSRKILKIVLATAIFAMCMYMFGIEKPAAAQAVAEVVEAAILA